MAPGSPEVPCTPFTLLPTWLTSPIPLHPLALGAVMKGSFLGTGHRIHCKSFKRALSTPSFEKLQSSTVHPETTSQMQLTPLHFSPCYLRDVCADLIFFKHSESIHKEQPGAKLTQGGALKASQLPAHLLQVGAN